MLWFVGGDNLTGALHDCLVAPVVTTISIILSSSKIQNGEIMVPANPGTPEKMADKTETERELTLNATFYMLPCLVSCL